MGHVKINDNYRLAINPGYTTIQKYKGIKYDKKLDAKVESWADCGDFQNYASMGVKLLGLLRADKVEQECIVSTQRFIEITQACRDEISKLFRLLQ